MEEKNGIRDSGASSHDIVLGCRLLLEEGLLFSVAFIFADADFLVFV